MERERERERERGERERERARERDRQRERERWENQKRRREIWGDVLRLAKYKVPVCCLCIYFSTSRDVETCADSEWAVCT